MPVQNVTRKWYQQAPSVDVLFVKVPPTTRGTNLCPTRVHRTEHRLWTNSLHNLCTHRYKISLRAEDIHPTNRDNKIISDFIFFGNQGLALTGHDASLLVSQVRGRHNYTPPIITDIVGKTYGITAEIGRAHV